MGCSGETARTRLVYWEELEIWQQLYAQLLNELRKRQALDLKTVVVDSTHVRAFGGGADSGPSPVNRRQRWTKHTLLTDGHGTPLAMISTLANTSDHRCLFPAVDQYPVAKGTPGRPRTQPLRLYADAGYDSDPARRKLRARTITPYNPPTKNGTRKRAGEGPLDRRANEQLAGRPQATPKPLRPSPANHRRLDPPRARRPLLRHPSQTDHITIYRKIVFCQPLQHQDGK